MATSFANIVLMGGPSSNLGALFAKASFLKIVRAKNKQTADLDCKQTANLKVRSVLKVIAVFIIIIPSAASSRTEHLQSRFKNTRSSLV